MDPATLTLVAMLSAGAFGCLALLYVSIPYPAPVNPDMTIPDDPFGTGLPDAEGPECDETQLPLAA